MAGWVKLHRKLLNSAVFHNPKTLQVWIWCLCKATRVEYEELVGNMVVPLRPGQFVTGRKKAAAELSMPEGTFRDQLEILKNLNMISVRATNKFSVVTIENWALYQGEGEGSRQQTASKPTAKRHIQEKGEDKEKRFVPPSFGDVRQYCSERGNAVDPAAFIDFYTSVGWKIGTKSMKDWRAAVRTWEKRQKPTEQQEQREPTGKGETNYGQWGL